AVQSEVRINRIVPAKVNVAASDGQPLHGVEADNLVFQTELCLVSQGIGQTGEHHKETVVNIGSFRDYGCEVSSLATLDVANHQAARANRVTTRRFETRHDIS